MSPFAGKYVDYDSITVLVPNAHKQLFMIFQNLEMPPSSLFPIVYGTSSSHACTHKFPWSNDTPTTHPPASIRTGAPKFN